MLRPLGGSGLKAALLHPHDAYWDLRLGVRTFGFVRAVGDPSRGDWRAHYQPTSYRTLFGVFEAVALGAEDDFVDLGAGLGRAVFVAHHLGARRAVGVELDGRLHRRALQNRTRAGIPAHRVELVRASADEHRFDHATVVFLFHPFGAGTLARSIAAIDASLDRAPRALRLAYLNPVHAAIVDGSRHLVRLDPARPRRRLDPDYALGVWTTAR